MLRYLESMEPPFPQLLSGPPSLLHSGSPADPVTQVLMSYHTASIPVPAGAPLLGPVYTQVYRLLAQHWFLHFGQLQHYSYS